MADHSMGGPTDFLAAERTFLAWIRTGVALMGFGFVAARFGLFLQVMQINQPNLPRPYGLSFWFGTALIFLGVAVNIASTLRHVRLMRELREGGSSVQRPSALAIGVAVILALLGAAMAIYLVVIRDPQQSSLERPIQQPANSKEGREKLMTANAESGIVTIASGHSVEGTVQKLEGILQAKGVKLFALIDHSGEAEKAGLSMRPTKVLIFGNPKAGTPLMIAAPSSAIDLPLKVLVWEDADGRVWVSYNSPAYLAARHRLPAELAQNIAVVETLAAAAAK